MTTPNYKLRDDHVATVKHMRDERARNDLTYATKTQVDNIQQDTIVNATNPQSYMIARSSDVLNGNTVLDMNAQRIRNLGTGTQPNDAVTLTQLDTKADQTSTYTKTQTDSLLSAKTDATTTTALASRVSTNEANIDAVQTTLPTKADKSQLSSYLFRGGDTMMGALDMNGSALILRNDATDGNHAVRKSQMDTQLALKANVADVPTNSTVTALTNRVTAVEGSSSTNATNITTISNNLSSNYSTTTQANALYKPINQIESKIQNSGLQCSVECANSNLVAVRSGGQIIANMYAPTGQATNNQFLLETPDKFAVQSQSSSFSLYGGKTPSTSGIGTINTHQVVIGGRDDATKGVQANLNIGVGTAKIDVSAGHMDLGAGQTNFASVSADSSLLLSGGTPQVDPQLQIFSTAKATSLATSLPIQATAKMGYATTTTVDQANQFTSKAYVDTQDALKVSKTGDTMTGALTLSGAPTSNLHAATKAYVDSQVSTAGTGDFKKDGSVAMTGNLNMGTTNKIINLAAPTLTTDATNKTYVDSADALKLNLTGGTLTGALTLAADPSANLQASTKQYVDTQVATKQSQTQADARYLQLAGGTLTGNLILNANPSTNLGAATKQYVDSAVSSAGSGASISTAGGYSVVTSSSDIQHKKNGTTFLTESQLNSFYEEDLANGVTIRNYGIYDNSSVNYTHAKYLLTNSTSRPHFGIHDIGSEGTQCNRLSSYQWNGSTEQNELYINFKPMQQKFELSAPINYITEPTYSSTTLTSKTYVDNAVANISAGQVQNKIVSTTGTANIMTVQCNNGQVSVAKTGDVQQLQLSQTGITQVSGNQLVLSRGQSQLAINDDNTNQNLTSNVPAFYSNQYTVSSTPEQLQSQRMSDARYMKKNADSNLVMNSNKITGLADASAAGEAVTYGQLLTLLRNLGVRRSGSISIYVGDFAPANNWVVPSGQITGDSGFTSISATHKVTGASANYFDISVNHNWNTNNIRLFTQVYSTTNNTTQLTYMNDNSFGQWTTNILNPTSNQITFWLVYEPANPTTQDTVVQQNGYVILFQEWV